MRGIYIVYGSNEGYLYCIVYTVVMRGIYIVYGSNEGYLYCIRY